MTAARGPAHAMSPSKRIRVGVAIATACRSRIFTRGQKSGWTTRADAEGLVPSTDENIAVRTRSGLSAQPMSTR